MQTLMKLEDFPAFLRYFNTSRIVVLGQENTHQTESCECDVFVLSFPLFH